MKPPMAECFLTSPRQLRARQLRRRRRIIRASVTGVALALLAGVLWEIRESRIQAYFFSHYAQTAVWQMQPGLASSLWLPSEGPYPTRLGYTRLGGIVPRLTASGFEVTAQARQSARFREIVDSGFNPIYQEKAQAGLSIFDRHRLPIYSSRYPQHQYSRFENIPDLLVGALLFIENRELLDDGRERRNPAVDWGRLARAAAGQGLRKLHIGGMRAGGSTLATQIEKFRYSPGGRTQDADDKLRQMISASIRAYREGPETFGVRRQIVLDYLNSVPLGGVPRYGEVNGIGDGLWAWFGADFATTNAVLSDSAAPIEQRARAFKQGLMLLVAQRRPSGMLADRDGNAALERLTDSYLRLLGEEGLITGAMVQAALQIRVAPIGAPPVERVASFVDRKAVNEIRSTLGELMGVPDLYELDRFDLEVDSSFDGATQNGVTALLGRLSSVDFIRCAGLRTDRMLGRGDPLGVHYSVTLYESTPFGNRLRVQADNLNQPLDINAGTKLDLGSSAKLRTLVSYLNVIADLHRRYAGQDDEALRAVSRHPEDRLSSWAVSYLLAAEDKSLQAMLEAAMMRRYPADPKEFFFTGGGIHKFSNFKREDDAGSPPVAEALEQSVNLSFVRIMRDVVNYHAYEAADAPGRGLRLGDAEVRRALLDRFAEREGVGYLRTYWHKYRDVAAAERLALFVDGVPLRRATQAAAYLSVKPDASFDDFARFMAGRLESAAGTEAALQKLFEQHRSRRYSLSDQGYLARVHPLELWLVRYLLAKPEAALKEIVAASVEARREAQRWILAPRYRDAQNLRISTVVEVAAFERIAEEWKRLGYPFDQLVPSLATSIGSSADRPAALAELMGILVNDGIRQPTLSIEKIRFAAATPFETELHKKLAPGVRVLPEEVARVARNALLRVVDSGTARRIKAAFLDADGRPIAIGGKTGTGDHRSKVVGSDGSVISSRVMNRAATFAFYIGERHYGVVTAFVPGAKAAGYNFTSALPVQILKELEPALRPLISGVPAGAIRCESSPASPSLRASGVR